MSCACRGGRSVGRFHAFRRDELHSFDVSLQVSADDTVVLQKNATASKQQLAWLSGK